jgi:5-methylcytosine-specific restriction endonuclease McrA
MDNLSRLVLVINAAYEATNVISAKRALTLICKGAAVVEEISDHSIRTSRLTIPVPSIIRLLVYRKVPRQNRAVSRKSILLRDRMTCQYCGAVHQPRGLTLDHVVPKSRGGQNTWGNLVSACYPCNNRKASRTPEEAGMPLLHKPAQIGIHARHRLLVGTAADPAWDQYLFC